MKTRDWLCFFKKNKNIKIFHINHLKLLTHSKAISLRINLSRLSKQNIIARICRNYYANPFNLPTLDEISSQIQQPNYISLESALSRFGILSQMPHVLTCVTLGSPYKLQTSFGTISYQHIQKKYFFGFKDQPGCALAEPEKALLDYIYLNKAVLSPNLIELKEWNLNMLKKTKLKKYALKMNLNLPQWFF
ncbi:MAG: hypothetical protein AAB309_04200 [Deltaproteobacteria bacterium]